MISYCDCGTRAPRGVGAGGSAAAGRRHGRAALGVRRGSHSGRGAGIAISAARVRIMGVRPAVGLREAPAQAWGDGRSVPGRRARASARWGRWQWQWAPGATVRECTN